MFGFFFDHRVGSWLFKAGWRPDQLPETMLFSNICMALKAHGYTVESAAGLWNKVLAGDEVSIRQMRQDAGVFGIQYLGGSRDGSDSA